MIITNLYASNVKVIKAINITPDGNLVVVGGGNEQGKSSTLDSIIYALLGGRKVCTTPVRTGEDEAQIIVELGDLVVTKIIKANGNQYLTVTDKGKKVTSPQALLDSLTSALAFDPLAFTNMSPKDQLNTLKNLVGIDLSTLDEERQKCYEERTVIGRIRDQYKASLDTMAVPTITSTEKIDVQGLLKEISEANATNSQIDVSIRNKKELAENIVALDAEIERLLAIKAKRVEELNAFPPIADKIDIDALNVKLTDAMEINNSIDKNKQYIDTTKLLSEKSVEYNALTLRIQEIDAEKETKMASAKFPIDGLSFGEDGILYKGTPFSQASSAAKLKTSVAIGLAMNPELKVLLIPDGSLLDDDNLAMIAKMAEENDAQVWIERVGKGDEVSVVIEDGLIVEDRTGISKQTPVADKKPAKTRKKKTDITVVLDDSTISDMVVDTIDDSSEIVETIILDEVQSVDEVDPAILHAEEMICNVLGEYMEDTIAEIKAISEKDASEYYTDAKETAANLVNIQTIGTNVIKETVSIVDDTVHINNEITFNSVIEEVITSEPLIVNKDSSDLADDTPEKQFNAETVEEEVEQLVQFEPRKIIMPETDGIAIVNVPDGKRSIIDDEIDYDNTY